MPALYFTRFAQFISLKVNFQNKQKKNPRTKLKKGLPIELIMGFCLFE